MKKKGIIAGSIALITLIAILSPDKPIESIEISVPDYQTEYDINTQIPVDVSILPENANTTSLEYVSNGNTFKFSGTGITTGFEEGAYDIYVTSGDVMSNTITINVVDIAAREDLLAKAENERLAEEQAAQKAKEERLAEEQAAKAAEEKRLAEERAAKAAEEERLAEEQAVKETEKQKLAEEQAAKEAEKQKLAEEQAAKKAEEQNSVEENTAQESNSPSNTNTSESGSNFNTYDNASQQQTSDTYVLNTNTKKIHHPSCPSVKKIAPHNYSTSNSSVDELIGQGYSTCGNCFK